MTQTKKIVYIALLVAQALVLHIVERMIPINLGIPGAKLGLANIITLVSLYIFNFKDCFSIVIIRTALANFLAGSLSSFLFSISGGILSLIAMYEIKKIGKENISVIGVSIFGAVFHNIGQILIAAMIIQNLRITVYLPFLMISAIATGFFVGIVVKFLLKYLRAI